MKQTRKLRLLCAAAVCALTLPAAACALPEGAVPDMTPGRTPAAAVSIEGIGKESKYEDPAEQEMPPMMNEETRTWNIKSFGAVGDGRTDDYFALQRAVNSVLRAGGGTLFFPDGNYRMSSSLRITLPGEAPLTLCADPAAGATLTAAGTVEAPAVYVDHPHVTMRNVNVSHTTSGEQPGIVLASDYAVLDSLSVGMSAGNKQPGILVYGSYNTVKHCGVGYAGSTEHMVVISKKPGTVSYGNVLEDCHFGGTHGKCVLVTTEDDTGVPENVIIRRNVFLVVSCDQVELRAGKDIFVTDNMLDAAGICILLDPMAQGITGLQVTDNYCGASTGGSRTGGIRMENSFGGTVADMVVSANYFWCPDGISLPYDTEKLCITDNYFVLTGGNALYAENGNGAFLEGNVLANVSGKLGIRLGCVDDKTVIQHNAMGSCEVPDWKTRFASAN